MRLDVQDGQITIDAHDLAPLIGCTPSQVPELMRAGKITSVYERGEGDDAGRFRVSFRYRAARVRFTCLEDGTVVSQIRTNMADDA